MCVFRPVVGTQALIMDRAKPLLPDGEGVGLELVRGDALWREALLFQQLAEEPAC